MVQTDSFTSPETVSSAGEVSADKITDNTTDKTLLAQADAFIDAHWEEIVHEIGALVAIPSVVDFSHATPDNPSGPEAHRGLKAAVDLAQRLGLNAWDDAGEIGIADLEGKRKEQLAIICHTDVVTAGVGWTGNPWTLERRDGFLIGRGVIDDKGPLVISLYCMKFFKDWCAHSGRQLPYTLRMLLGTNEETGTMRDVRYYLSHYPAPAFLFTPDNAFPVCYGEKGQCNIALISSATKGRIVDFSTGASSTNAVPSQATLVLHADAGKLPAQRNIEIIDEGNGCARLVATGRGGHASLPEGTINAISILVNYVLDNHVCTSEEEPYLRLIGRIMDSTDGSSCGIASCDDYFGNLTCIVGTIHTIEGRLRTTVDIRYPTSIDHDTLLATFKTIADKANATVEDMGGLPPFLTKPDSPAIKTLAASYRDATGFDGDPFTIGGGTYAREFPCAASFGPEDAHDTYPDWVGPMHGADEGVSEESLKRAMRVYILTIQRLMNIDLATLAKE